MVHPSTTKNRAAWKAQGLCPVCGDKRYEKKMANGQFKLMSKCKRDLMFSREWASRKGQQMKTTTTPK